jgi:hypothetical protein
VPTGVTAIAVSFVQPGTGAKVIYRKAITDPSTMQQIISDVDRLHVDHRGKDRPAARLSLVVRR